MRNKTFKSDFYFFLEKVKNKENFSFLRFSDGEMYLLQDKGIILSDNKVKVDGIVDGTGPGHPLYDSKVFDPIKHEEFRNHLISSFLYKDKNYYKGISCRCCVGEVNYKWQLDNLEGDSDDLTWANILVNSNYPLFMEEFYPVIKNRGAVIICNEMADLTKHSWIKHDFRIGNNAFSNLDPITTIKEYIAKNNIQNELFLFSASSFSNVAQYELHKEYPNNTYIDIGTTLSYEIGIPSRRGYLEQYYSNQNVTGNCIW